MQKPPVIGITRCSRMDDYIRSVEQAGGKPRVLETSESPRKVVGELDGLLLTGGGDVDPVFYGEDRHPTIEDAEPGRDEFEIDLARRALSADLAVLAICRGAQVLNVAAGSRLERALGSAVDGARTCRVNSRHHQSVSRVGEGLVASATAPDGVIEAIEKPGARFCLGVQWHPENFCNSGEFSPLFTAFIESARRR